MPLDILEVFGVEYTNVTGIKATDDNGILQTYIRPQGTKNISSNGTNIDVTEYATVDVAVSAPAPNLQDKTATPTTSTQIITADNGYDALQQVTVNPIPSNYIVPTGTIQISGNGTYDVSAYATAEASFASTINNQNKTVTPSESQQTVSADSGYTGLGTVTVEAVSNTYVGSGITSRSSTDLSASGATVSVPAGYYAEVASKSVASGSATAPASISGSSASITTGTNTITLTKMVSVTPSVSAGYVSSGTAGNSSVSLTASVTVNPTPTASGATVTIPAGYYSSQTTKSVSTTTHPNPTASINSSTGLVTASHTQTAGYVSAGTTTGTLQLTTQAAATITPTTSSQTAVAAGRYTTGAITVAAIPSNYVDASSLKTYYTGSSVPSSSLGGNGDLYFQTSGA